MDFEAFISETMKPGETKSAPSAKHTEEEILAKFAPIVAADIAKRGEASG